MRHGFYVAAMLATGLCFVTVAQAADVPHIGVVNLQTVVGNSHRGQDAQAQLKDLAQHLRSAVQDRRQKLTVLKQQLDKADSKSKDYAKLQKSYQDGVADYQQYVAANQQDLEERKQELLQPIEQELQKVLNAFAKDNHYDILLNQNGAGAVYASDKYDVTTQVTEAMDKDWAEQQKSESKPAAKSKNGKG
ncbi:MAG TPA: OmpH family outer membrane protein [Gammaproteobacteria bacterium]|nr:OmpH family outer membrane protein [Gammaproteobacteria bacterium]